MIVQVAIVCSFLAKAFTCKYSVLNQQGNFLIRLLLTEICNTPLSGFQLTCRKQLLQTIRILFDMIQ